jgi:ATP-dependent Clp protease protease subunit
MAERIAYHTGQSVEQIAADSERDRWFTAEQAKDYGIIDNVITRRGQVNSDDVNSDDVNSDDANSDDG